jgi:hypothetical protein
MSKIVLMDWQRGKIPFFMPPHGELQNQMEDNDKNKDVNIS